MSKASLLRTLLGLALAGLSLPAVAYYDDVHYGLTYYIARQTGFTHWQAYRIASACSRVDYDEQTEPVQIVPQLLDSFSPLGGDVHRARTRFHAFRYDGSPSLQVIHREKDGAAAQDKVFAELREFFTRAVRTHRNPGAYLHALQDVVPHFGYGSLWGHNPADSTVFARVRAQGLPIGSTTDWVSYRPNDVQLLCQTTNAHLKPFMESISPYQVPQGYVAHEYSPLITALAEANPHPAPLTTDDERLQFMYVAMADRKIPVGQIMILIGGEEQFRRVTAELRKPEVAARMDQHLRGPNMERAYEVIDRALADAGFPERLPRHPIEYDLGGEGGPVNPSQLDEWVLVGSARLSTSGNQAVTAKLSMDVRDASGKMKRTPLKIDPVTIRANSSHTWENLPIGDVYAELTRRHGPPITVRMGLNKRKNVFGPVNVGGPPPPKPTRLPPPTAQPPKARTVNTGNFSGEWDTWVAAPFRIPISLTMSQSGTKVTGRYKMEGRFAQDGKDVVGTLEGTVKGNILTYKWKDNQSEGTGTFRLVDGGKGFRGSFGVGKARPSRLWDGARK